MHCKEHLHVLVDRVIVALRDELREQAPVARRLHGTHTVGPVLDNELAPQVQGLAVRNRELDIGQVVAGTLQKVGHGRKRIELLERVLGQREWGNLLPKRRHKDLCLASGIDQGLPMVRIDGVYRARPGCGRQTKRHRRIPRLIERQQVGAGVVRVRKRIWNQVAARKGIRQVTALVGAVVESGVDDRDGGHVADTLRRGEIGREIGRVIAET